MKFVFIGMLCTVTFCGDRALASLCKPEVVEPSKGIYSKICPLMKENHVNFGALLDCKERNGYNIRYCFKKCAEDEFHNETYAEPSVVERMTCDDQNIGLIDHFACCTVSVCTKKNLNATAILDISEKCANNTNYGS